MNKNAGPQKHKGNNLAKLNDAKCMVLALILNRSATAKSVKCMLFVGLSSLKNARIAFGKE